MMLVYSVRRATMDTLLIIILFGFVVGLVMTMLRPAPRTQVIYVPVEVADERGGGLGCLPLIVIAFLMLLALGVIRF